MTRIDHHPIECPFCPALTDYCITRTLLAAFSNGQRTMVHTVEEGATAIAAGESTPFLARVLRMIERRRDWRTTGVAPAPRRAATRNHRTHT